MLDQLGELDDTGTRVKVVDLENDLFDGLVLKTLISKLAEREVILPTGENVQSQERQYRNLEAVLKVIEEVVEVKPEEIKYDNQNF